MGAFLDFLAKPAIWWETDDEPKRKVKRIETKPKLLEAQWKLLK